MATNRSMFAAGRLAERLPASVISARWPIILASLLVVALAGSGVRHLTFTNSYRIYFGADDPHLKAFERLEQTYTKDDTVMLVIAPANGNVFTRENLALVEALTERAWQVPFANRVDSITNFQHTEARGDDLVVADLVRDAIAFTDNDLKRVRDVALSEPQLRKFLIAEDGAVTAVNINILLPGVDEVAEQPLMIAHVRSLAAEFEATHPGLEIYISGMGAFHVATTESAVYDMSVLAPLSFGVMFLLVACLAGGIVGTFATLSVFSLSVVGAMGISGYLGYPITPTGASTPNVILTVAVANSVHILISYFQELRQGRARNKAIEESLRVNAGPVALASITTSIGFLAMNFSETPPFQMMGTTVAIGVLFSLVLSLSFLPALLAVLPAGKRPARSAEDTWIRGLGEFVVRRRRSLLWGMTILVVILVANVQRNEFNDLFFEFFDETVEFRCSSDFMLDHLTGLYTIHYSLEAADSGGISEPEYLRAVDGFAAWWRSQPETEHVSAITDTMKRLNQDMHSGAPDMYRLPDTRELAAQYLLLYEMSLPYGLELNNQINVDKSSSRVVATLRPMSVTETLDISRRAGRWLDENAPAIGHDDGSGMVMMFTHLMRRNTISMLFGTTLALGLISIVIVVALRSVRIGALSLVTNLAPIGMGFGIWGLINGEVGIALSIVASMTFGIVVDDTVHFLSKYLRARREQEMSAQDAVRYAFAKVGRALIVTSIVLVSGFLVLACPHFGLNSEMGLSVAIVILCALVTVLLFLPPLLMKLEHADCSPWVPAPPQQALP